MIIMNFNPFSETDKPQQRPTVTSDQNHKQTIRGDNESISLSESVFLLL